MFFPYILSNCLETLEQYVLQFCKPVVLVLFWLWKMQVLVLIFFPFQKTGNTYQVLEKVVRAHLDHFWTLLVFFLSILQVFYFLFFFVATKHLGLDWVRTFFVNLYYSYNLLMVHGINSWILCCISRVHLALYTEKAASKSICCYPWLHVSGYTFSWSYFASKWCWFVSFFHSYKSCGKARGFSSGKGPNTSRKRLLSAFYRVQFTCNTYYLISDKLSTSLSG